ncbi:ABC transporter permease [Acidobacteria bacterium AH-259-L09]|nr:ABC transporter permease [Acidobacteria bacterium AH-259-L09]
MKTILMQNIQKSFLLVALVVVCLVFGFLEPRFLTVGNLINIARQISINLIIAVGMTFCIIGGGFDLSVGSVGAMSGVLTGLVLVETGSVSLGILSGLVGGTTAGLINGLCISRLKVNSFVTTLGMMVAARGVALILTGGDVILGFPEAFNFLGVGFIAGIPVPIIIAAAVTILGHLVLSRTEFGLNVYAVGGNYAAAKLAGLRNERIITMVFTAQGLLAALGGIVLMARVVSAQPALMQETNLDVIAAVVVGGTSLAGGRGGIGGTLLGSILLGTLFNGLNIVGIGYEWQLVAIGLIIVMAVAVDNLSRR